MASDDAGYPGPSPVSDHSLFASDSQNAELRGMG